MKHFTKVFGISVLCCTLLFNVPVMSQTGDSGSTTSAMADDHDDDGDSGKWGLLGLLGLAGLLGLKRRDDDRHRGTTATTNR
jgi:MYXO-CTERM domain-containing protein